MLATDRFLLISIGRTGTGALHKWLQKVEGLQIISNKAHEPYWSMVEKCEQAGLPIPPAWTIIRNPFDYYVDKWCWERDKGPCFKGSFKEFLNITRKQPTVEGYFYSLTQKWDALGADECGYIARFEHYDDDVVNILLALADDLLTEKAIRQNILETLDYGASYLPEGGEQFRDTNFQRWYDSEMRDWVSEMDGVLIERFRYSFLDESQRWL